MKDFHACLVVDLPFVDGGHQTEVIERSVEEISLNSCLRLLRILVHCLESIGFCSLTSLPDLKMMTSLKR